MGNRAVTGRVRISQEVMTDINLRLFDSTVSDVFVVSCLEGGSRELTLVSVVVCAIGH